MIRAELAHLLRLALPIVVTQLSQMGMGVADTIMAGRYGAIDLAGVALGANVFWPTVMLLAGVIMAVVPSVSQLHGAGRHAGAGEVVRQALWIAVAGGALLILLYRNTPPLLAALGVDPQAIPVAGAYLDALSWGVLPLLGYFALRYLCEGMSWTTPAMVVAFVGLLAKIPLNYLFIYGAGPLPAMGGVGCGWASALVMWLELLVLVAVVANSRIRLTGLFSRVSRPAPAQILRLLKLGVPIGLTIFLEFSLFSLVTLLIGRLGVNAVAAHQIATNVGGLTFMVPMAIGTAVAVRVGYNVGAGRLDDARRSGWVALGVALAFALIVGTLLYLFRGAIAGLYSNDSAVTAVAMELMVFVAVYQLVDDTQVTAMGALRGFKDTRTPLVIALFAYWAVGFPVGMTLGFGWVELPAFVGVRGFWVGLSLGLCVAAVVLTSRFAWLSRRHGRVLQLAAR
ncbi:MAG TPA: MATE family efflux transporter [Pseudomonadales bacterium]